MSTDNERNPESINDKPEGAPPLTKQKWIVNYHDPDFTIAGFDLGGGPIYEYKGKRFTGTIREYFLDGSLGIEETCLRGFPEGLKRGYYRNGQLAEESYITHNWHYGPFIQWDESGAIIKESNFGFSLPIAKWILAIDVYYYDNTAKCVGVLFNQFNEDQNEFYVEYLNDIEEYFPGEFYKRELPCILKILEKVDLKRVFMIMVDSHVYIDNDENYGLGGKLWEQLDCEIPVIGVAKTRFAKNMETIKEVFRGESKNPLYVSSIGMTVHEAAYIITTMKGAYRVPDILKLLDQKTKSAV